MANSSLIQSIKLIWTGFGCDGIGVIISIVLLLVGKQLHKNEATSQLSTYDNSECNDFEIVIVW